MSVPTFTNGSRLAQLYPERCYRLVEEDVHGAEDVEARIREREGRGFWLVVGGQDASVVPMKVINRIT